VWDVSSRYAKWNRFIIFNNFRAGRGVKFVLFLSRFPLLPLLRSSALLPSLPLQDSILKIKKIISKRKMTTTKYSSTVFIVTKALPPPSSASSVSSSMRRVNEKSKQLVRPHRRRLSRRVVYFGAVPSPLLLASSSPEPQEMIKIPSTSSGDGNHFKKKKTKVYKRKSYRKRFSLKPPAPHNTTSMLMDAYSEIDSEGSDSQHETDFNFSGSFLPSLTKEDYEEFFCNSSIEFA
jgi:hypothetical protein